MRPQLLCFLLLGSILLATLASGCGGTVYYEKRHAGDGSVDTGGKPAEGGDGPADGGQPVDGSLPDTGLPDTGLLDSGHDSADAPIDTGRDVVTALSVGGTVSGLLGTGLVLQNLGIDDTIAKNGPFTFTALYPSGTPYAVTVLAQPTSPAQTCTVSGGIGILGTTNVTSVVVTCATDAYTIGGHLKGLSGTVVLQDNGGDNLTLLGNGVFVFATPVAGGAPYSVTVLTQPATKECTVTNGSGIVAGANVTNVSVVCTNPPFTIGGTVSGLTGAGLVLQDNGGDDLPIPTSGPFTFSKTLTTGKTYAVTVLSQPSGQYCTVTSGSGTVAGANVTTVAVACATATTYTIGGTLSGLATGDSVVLQDNLADNLTVATNGSFTFATPIAQSHAYSVTVLTNPASPAEYCVVSNGSGTVGSGPVTNVVVTCYAPSSECGRFTTGYTGAWSTVAVNPFSSTMGMSGYVPAGGTSTIYLNDGTSFDEYAAGTNTYTPLAGAPVAMQSYGSTAWLGGALWSVTSGDVLQYDLTSGTWSIAAKGLTSANDAQTTSDDAGNLWSYSTSGTLPSLLEYNVSSGTTTYHTLTSGLGAGFSEPRVTFDSCTGLLYIADYAATPFYSYDPASGTQTLLASLPAKNQIQDGFCGDKSGHIFAVTNTSTMYQYTIASGVWAAMPAGGPRGSSNSACGVGADGYLYATDPDASSTMYRIQLN